MRDQRRHQRIRFSAMPLVRIGQAGLVGSGELENLSQGGLMVRTGMPLRVGEPFGCEFSVFDSALIDLSAEAVSKVGDCFGARFLAGPISERLIQDAIDRALALGRASILSVNELDGRKVMRIAGGLNGSLRSDFMYSLTRVGISDIDLSGVTDIDFDGLELCQIAVEQHKVGLVRPSPCVRSVMAGHLA